MTRPHVLVAAPALPEYDKESGSRRLLDLVRYLREADMTVSFITRDAMADGRYRETMHQMGVPTYRGDRTPLQQLIVAERFDLAILAFWYVAESYLPIIRTGSPSTRVVVDTVDLHFLRNARRVLGHRPHEPSPGLLDQSYGSRLTREINTYAQADAVLTVSQKEADLVEDFVGDRLAYCVPDAVEPAGDSPPLDARRGIVFVGNFRHEPNVEAARFLVEEVVPRIDESVLAAHPVSVVGNEVHRIGDVVRSHPSVHAVGWVPSVTPYLQRARVSVIPLLYGAGTKRKLIQSLMLGTPAVSTTVGTEGLGLVDGEHVLVADDPESFATSVAHLASDDAAWRRLSFGGHALITPSHSPEVVSKRLIEAVSSILERPSRPTRRPPVPGGSPTPRPSASASVVARAEAYLATVTRVRDAVQRVVPTGRVVLVVSKGDPELTRYDGRRAWHFPQTPDGVYAGHHPKDSAAAIEHLEEVRARGAGYFVIPSTASWWLQHYHEFGQYLEDRFRRVWNDADCTVFELGAGQVATPRPRADRGSDVEQQESPIIVYGAPRSGTTYLARILNEHPDVFVTHETRLFAWVNRSLNDLTLDDELVLSERANFVQHLRQTFPPMVREFYRQLRPRARYWGDKNPHYASSNNGGCLETIDELFPGTRFLHIVRDGRDVVSSLIRKRHPNGDPWIDFVGAHEVWTSHLDNGSAFGRSLPPDRYFELKYEDLIRADEEWGRRIFEFLDIPMDPKVVEFCRSQRDQRTPLSGPTRDLDRGVERSEWSTSLSPAEQRGSLALLRTHLVRYGYEVERPKRTAVRTAKRGGSSGAAKPRASKPSKGSSDPGNSSNGKPSVSRARGSTTTAATTTAGKGGGARRPRRSQGTRTASGRGS